MSLSASLQEFSRAMAKVYPGATNADTADIPWKEIAAMLGGMQTRSMSQNQGSFSASITGTDGSMSFSGFEVFPSLQVSVGSITPEIHAVHQTASVQRLNMALYTQSGIPNAVKETNEKDFPKRVALIIRTLVTDWRKQVFPSMTQTEKTIAERVHNQNTEPLKIVYDILTKSDKFEIDGMDKLAQTIPTVNNALNNWILWSLTSESEGFWERFLEMNRKVGLFYAPSIGGAEDYGTLVNTRKAFEDAEDFEDVDSITFQPNLQLPEVPITYVIMPHLPFTSSFKNYKAESKLLPGQVSPSILRYPPGQVTGHSQVISPPPYIVSTLQNMSSLGGFGSSLSGKAHDQAEKLDNATTPQVAAMKTFLLSYMRNIFHAIQLQGSSFGMTTILSPKWQVGKAYRVSQSGVLLFKGMLASCSHTVSSSPDSPQAFTQLSFSHVQWGGFSLPFE